MVATLNKNILQQCVCFSACSSELSFKAEVSSGQVSGQAWCAGDSNEFQWITLDLGGERKISGEQGILPSWGNRKMGFFDKYLYILEYQFVDHSQSALQVKFLVMLNIAICVLSNVHVMLTIVESARRTPHLWIWPRNCKRQLCTRILSI